MDTVRTALSYMVQVSLSRKRFIPNLYGCLMIRAGLLAVAQISGLE